MKIQGTVILEEQYKETQYNASHLEGKERLCEEDLCYLYHRELFCVKRLFTHTDIRIYPSPYCFVAHRILA